MDTLPRDILNLILQRIPIVHLCVDVNRVCQRWHALIESDAFWKEYLHVDTFPEGYTWRTYALSSIPYTHIPDTQLNLCIAGRKALYKTVLGQVTCYGPKTKNSFIGTYPSGYYYLEYNNGIRCIGYFHYLWFIRGIVLYPNGDIFEGFDYLNADNVGYGRLTKITGDNRYIEYGRYKRKKRAGWQHRHIAFNLVMTSGNASTQMVVLWSRRLDTIRSSILGQMEVSIAVLCWTGNDMALAR